MVSKREHVSSYDQFHPGRFIKAADLGDKPRTFKVKDYWREDLSGAGSGRDDDEPEEGDKKRDFKGVLQFEEKHLGKHIEYPTQKTNEVLLAAMFGTDPRNVIGKRITLVAGKDRFGKKQVDAIRIYGSPDIDREMQVRVEYSKRTGRPPQNFTLRPTGTKKLPPATEANLNMAIAVLEIAPSIEQLKTTAADLKMERAWSDAQSKAIKTTMDKRVAELKAKKPEPVPDPVEELGPDVPHRETGESKREHGEDG